MPDAKASNQSSAVSGWTLLKVRGVKIRDEWVAKQGVECVIKNAQPHGRESAAGRNSQDYYTGR